MQRESERSVQEKRAAVDEGHVDHISHRDYPLTLCGIAPPFPLSYTPRFATTCVVCVAVAHAWGIPVDDRGRLIRAG